MRLSLQHRLKLASALSVRVGALGGVCWALAAPLQAQTVVPAAPIENATEASETDSAFWSRQERLEAAQIPSLQKRVQSAREMWNKASAPALARLRAQPVSAAAVGATFAGQQTRSVAQWEVEAPRVALAFYGRWLTQEAQQLWPQGRAASRSPGAESYTWMQVCSIAAQLQARDVGEPRAALAIYDWALQSGADLVALSRLELERDHLIGAQLQTAPRSTARAGWERTVPVPLLSQVAGTPAPAMPATLVRRSAAMAQVLAGTLTLHEAWQQKLLSRDDVLGLLSQPKISNVPQERQGEIRLELAGLLARALPEGEAGLQEAAKWNSAVRLNLANYFRSVRDERAVTLYEGLLQELDEQVNKSGPLNEAWIEPLAHLAFFYTETEQWQNALNTWNSATAYSKKAAWLADALIEKARVYRKMGDYSKAREVYAQVPPNSGWIAGVSLFDQAQQLIAQDKHEEARKLLSFPIEGPNVDRVRPALQTLLGTSYYRDGDLKTARECFVTALDQYKSLPATPSEAYKMEGTIRRTHEFIRWIDRWNKSPIYWHHKALVLKIDGQSKTIEWQGVVCTRRPVTLAASCKDLRIQVEQNDDKLTETAFFAEVPFVVRVELKEWPKQLDQTVTITSPQIPNSQVQLPIRVSFQSPSILSVGVQHQMAHMEDVTRSDFKISAFKPFRILDITADNSQAKVESVDMAQLLPQHAINLHTFLEAQDASLKHTRRTQVRITSDLEGQEVVNVQIDHIPP